MREALALALDRHPDPYALLPEDCDVRLLDLVTDHPHLFGCVVMDDDIDAARKAVAERYHAIINWAESSQDPWGGFGDHRAVLAEDLKTVLDQAGRVVAMASQEALVPGPEVQVRRAQQMLHAMSEQQRGELLDVTLQLVYTQMRGKPGQRVDQGGLINTVYALVDQPAP